MKVKEAEQMKATLKMTSDQVIPFHCVDFSIFIQGGGEEEEEEEEGACNAAYKQKEIHSLLIPAAATTTTTTTTVKLKSTHS